MEAQKPTRPCCSNVSGHFSRRAATSTHDCCWMHHVSRGSPRLPSTCEKWVCGSAAVRSGIRRESWQAGLGLRALHPPLLLLGCLPGSIFLSRYLLLVVARVNCASHSYYRLVFPLSPCMVHHDRLVWLAHEVCVACREATSRCIGTQHITVNAQS